MNCIGNFCDRLKADPLLHAQFQISHKLNRVNLSAKSLKGFMRLLVSEIREEIKHLRDTVDNQNKMETGLIRFGTTFK